ncbi:hypothetical protein [Nocardiopsis sp. HUAS JQ3]|uniref:hypothetical protein n=1 Tax=Nocardiopsis sp. HUAS JQ3 TaxID=3061629 RepID=UPI0023A94096|nr:hypothetical protein [Nocardiopsis sp. HUAS JQ3]WDZ91128.1 hypothetical protein PV789_00700 [Nocardiopsis sp. HUAS JQ3]
MYTLDDQRDILVTADAVIADGRELTGAEVGELLATLDAVRLETLWREIQRTHPLGSWVRGADGAQGPDRVVGYHRGGPGAPGHELDVRTARGEHRRVPVAEAWTVPAPRGER